MDMGYAMYTTAHACVYMSVCMCVHMPMGVCTHDHRCVCAHVDFMSMRVCVCIYVLARVHNRDSR